MAVERGCQLCPEKGKNTVIVVTSNMVEVCWKCVAEAVDYYRDAMKEGGE